jgi:hypothetical protein
MASTINSNNIDITYPIAGQDNDTQGFRDNFRNIKNNLNTARQEISELQDDVALTAKINYAGGIPSANVSYPSSSSDVGVRGQITWGPNPFVPTYLYICVATGNGELGPGDNIPRWIRVNIDSTSF